MFHISGTATYPVAMDAYSLTPRERWARARTDMALGVPVAVARGDRLTLVAAAETVSSSRLASMTAKGTAELALTHWRADTLKIRVYDGDLARVPLPPGTTTAAVRDLIDPTRDLSAPLKGPFATCRDGDAEAARIGLALAKAAHVLPAVILCRCDTVPPGVTLIHGTDGAPHAHADPTEVIAARLPLQVAEESRLHVYRPDGARQEHYAVEIGRPDRAKPVLTRIHSACFTGDVLGSLKCDCGPQLHAALDAMAAAGGGVLLYLNQEGRGIGLANKMRAYALQDQGFDTVEANHRLGFDDDERDFGIGADMLRALGIETVRLMTNNPRKLARLQAEGISVAERVPLWVGETRFNRDYLRVKADRSGHLS